MRKNSFYKEFVSGLAVGVMIMIAETSYFLIIIETSGGAL